MAEKYKIFVCMAMVLQMYDAAITGSNAIYRTNSMNQATGGIAVDHPAQVTIYPKRGKINVLIPFEFTIIPFAQDAIEPEVASRTNIPVTGPITSQSNSNYYRTNQNAYRPVYYQASSYPWYNNNYSNRGFYVPATPLVPNQQYQNNGYRSMLYQQQLPANTYRSQYYSPNGNQVYAPSYQQQPLRRTEVRPWPQYNHPNRLNQSQQQQQQTAQPGQPGQPNWPANNTKPININEMNSMHPPNAITAPAPSNNNNQMSSVAANSTTSTNTTAGTIPAIKPTITTTINETTPTTNEQSTVSTDASNRPPNPNTGNANTQKEKTNSIDAEPVQANQRGEATSDKKGDSLSELQSNLPQNGGETDNGGKDETLKSRPTDTAPTPIENNNIAKSENNNNEQASVDNIN